MSIEFSTSSESGDSYKIIGLGLGVAGLVYATQYPEKVSGAVQKAWGFVKQPFENGSAKTFFNGYRQWGAATLAVSLLGPVFDRAIYGLGGGGALLVSLGNLALHEVSGLYDEYVERKRIREATASSVNELELSEKAKELVKEKAVEKISDKIIALDRGKSEGKFNLFTRYAAPLIAGAGLMVALDRGLVRGSGNVAMPLAGSLFCLSIAGLSRFFQKTIFKNL